MPDIYEWKAQPRQLAFLNRVEKEVLFGGARGGGKTDAAVVYMILRAEKYPGSRHLILRRQWMDLMKSGGAASRSHVFLDGRAQWNGQFRRWTFPNGSTIEFGHCKDEDDKQQYQGPAWDSILFEEVTQFSETQYFAISAAARTTRNDLETRIRATGNPGGVGHGWVKRHFVAPFPAGNITLTDPQTGRSKCYVPSRVYDNYALVAADPEYVAALKALPESLRRAWLEGSWDTFEGQAFTEFDPVQHVVEPFHIPDTWRRLVAIDYGYNAPYCALWMAQDPAPPFNVVVYREVYERWKRDALQVKTILKAMSPAERQIIRAGIADPAMWQRKGENEVSPADIYMRGGLPLVPAKNDRIHGKQRVHEFLALDVEKQEQVPALRIFRTCANLVRTLPDLVYDQHRVEDIDTKTEDHAYDALRYGLMALSRRPLRVFDVLARDGSLTDTSKTPEQLDAERRMAEIATGRS